MKVLVTGAKGFVGKNLVHNLYNLKNGTNRTRPNLHIDEIYEYDIDSTQKELDKYCASCDFVFNLAGVNRPKNDKEFAEGNFGFASVLLECLKKNNNKAPVMLSSSIHATFKTRCGITEYGRTKRAGEDLFLKYGKENSIKVLVYRFPNVIGKWVRPNYNSAVGTFCYNIANDLPVFINDPNLELELLYIDDLVEEMLDALDGHEHRCDFCDDAVVPNYKGEYCYCPTTYKATLGYIVEKLKEFNDMGNSLMIPKIPDNSFDKKLFSMFLSYLPKCKAKFALKSNFDDRGSFTELLHFLDNGQISVNISKPGITKGNHWHNSKWELFIVIKGRALIQERNIVTGEMMEFEVSGDKIESVVMLPGYTHNIINLSDTEELVTIMYANENFNSKKPDTFSEVV